MIRELKTFEYTCDKCGYVLVATEEKFSYLPKGWKSIKASGQKVEPDRFCEWLDVCPACVAESEPEHPISRKSKPSRRKP